MSRLSNNGLNWLRPRIWFSAGQIVRVMTQNAHDAEMIMTRNFQRRASFSINTVFDPVFDILVCFLGPDIAFIASSILLR
jgi:hypothetical protein